MKNKINIINKTERSINYEKLGYNVISLIADDYKYFLKNVNFIFMNDKMLLEINKTFLEKDYLTDIITFNLNNNNIIDADIYVSLDRVEDNAKKNQKTYYNELNRVLFHGILHIVGEDDKTEDKMLIMRGKEDYYLEKIDVPRETK